MPNGTSTATPGRTSTEQTFLDAAERLLIEVGYGAISTRLLAEEAGVNAGLVHYYFGSMDRLFVRVLERFTARLIARQRAMYSADRPFIDKWRQAMRYLELDREYQKIWLELQALAWNRPQLREEVARVNAEWRAVLTEAFARPRERYAVDIPLDALISLVMTFNEGLIMERLSGVEAGHRELLDWIDGLLEKRDPRAGTAPG